MRFRPRKCPLCGQEAKGVLETIPGVALLAFADDGDAQYAGETDVCWDDQTTVRDCQGRPTLVCSDGHQWLATLDGVTSDEETATATVTTCSYDLVIDGAQLQAQRKRLLEIASTIGREATICVRPEDVALLDGLIDLTDEIADQAVDRHGIDSLIAPCDEEDAS